MQTVQKSQKLPKDLCPECLFAKFSWIPVYRGIVIIRWQIAKKCFAKKGLKGLFYIDEKFFGIGVEKIMDKCDKFMNATLFGYSSNPNNFREMLRKMPKIDSEIAEANPPEEGHNYVIESTSLETTGVSGYKAVRVLLTEVGKTKPYKTIVPEVQKTTMLWLRETAGSKSKLGTFLLGFQNHFTGSDEQEKDKEYFKDIDHWVGHVITITKWKERNREIKVLS